VKYRKMAHQKHAKLKRPAMGAFHRQEWSIIGAPCSKIQRMARQLSTQLSAEYRLAYVDADHSSAEEAGHPGWHQEYTDKIAYHRLDFKGEPEKFQFRSLLQDSDAALVNGNHYPAERQIVWLDGRKRDSLQRKLQRLTNVVAILYSDQQKQPYDFLQEALGDRLQQIPFFHESETDELAELLAHHLQEGIAPLRGLVLAGGKSERMGEDKGMIKYHGKPQRLYIAEQLSPLCDSIHLSVRKGQEPLSDVWSTITDTFIGLGPYGALLSAFREDPDAAWLAVACDLPHLDKSTLQQLVDRRDASRVATAFYSPATGFPEPLLTIWEPRAYPVLLQFLAQGYSCPRKVLINTDIKILQVEDDKVLRNANTPEEKEEAMRRLNS